MTFTVFSLTLEPYTIDIETLDDLQELASFHGWKNMIVNFSDMTITIE
jgi:hypothetical protein